MALNPITYTEKIVQNYLRYQLAAYSFADDHMHKQMHNLLSLDATRKSPLLKGPYVSLSRTFRRGSTVGDLINEGVFHPHMQNRIPKEITHLYRHQEEAIRAIRLGKTTLISTNTGSGKTECFLYPMISKCLELRDERVPPGISAVIVYPMNALAEDQLGRLRQLLAGTGIPFGMYVGKTPEKENGVVGIRLPTGSSRADYETTLRRVRHEERSETVYPPEEVCSREAMRTPGQQPRILLTNVKQLELLLTRQKDVELFENARLDFLIFDEVHTFTGALGAETACLIRRLRRFCSTNTKKTVCVATSATIVDESNPDVASDFAARFFGVQKDNVITVSESHEPDSWAEVRHMPNVPGQETVDILAACVSAVDDKYDTEAAVRKVFKDLTGQVLPNGNWQNALYSALHGNELIYQLNEVLSAPRALHELPAEIEHKTGRLVTEAEILCWLTLGAAARTNDSRPLLRPVVHGFIRGISGAVVSFPEADNCPRLWLAAEDEIKASGAKTRRTHFPVMTCTTCGQHYFVTFLKDFKFTGRSPDGGEAKGDEACWMPLDEIRGGQRVVLTNRIVGGSADENIERHDRRSQLHFCRYCGTAHPQKPIRCLGCGRMQETVALYAVQSKKDTPGFLSSCLSCGANGRRVNGKYREPARPVRATNVADVHVLAQDMVHHSERPRLLVFCDNRQDAAFQAGWMKDHARRYRLRSLMAEGIGSDPISIGDLTLHISEILEKDAVLSRALVPEVWQVVRREGGGGRHEEQRRKFLRIQVLREVTISARQPIGLEPWGRMKVEYEGLTASLPWIQNTANHLALPPSDLYEGVASLLDYLRHKRVLYDPELRIFTRFWRDGDTEVQQGYLPSFGGPIGTKLRRKANEKSERVTQWLTTRGNTTIRQIVKKWGVPPENIESFTEKLFSFLVDIGLLKPVQLKGSREQPLPNVSGVYQVDADRLRLRGGQGIWRCKSCRRCTTRRVPNQKCPAWQCKGDIEFVQEDPNNYNLQVLDKDYSMLRPEEHTAMVPNDERERLENLFKGNSEAVNAFVCTPTLELGVDIGKIDSVLMRNVPPLPTNYWQRAGRAGRRHRMAVNLTYCRSVSHDRAYFADPVKLLAGRIDPPAFNLRNELMVAKHVHAAIITRLHQHARNPSSTDELRYRIENILHQSLPPQVNAYLFEERSVRSKPFNFLPLRDLIEELLDDLTTYVEETFSEGWPASDAEVTNLNSLRCHITNMVNKLEEVVMRLQRRLNWAREQIRRLNTLRETQGTLDREDDSLFKSCDRLIKRLRGDNKRARREAEGYEDTNTFGVLAAEGFLPGYGLEVGSVRGMAEIPFWRMGAMEFTLSRPSSVALREYVPGNLIYANGNRFVARRFHREIDEQLINMPIFEVSTERQAVKETKEGREITGLGAQTLKTISVCDVDLIHQSHISDEEELRFQLGVVVHGLERGQHNGGTAFTWGKQELHFRRGVRLRLVNVGAAASIKRFNRLGYPICTVCGQSVSPLASDRQIQHFAAFHGHNCGKVIQPVGIFSDVVADALSLPACRNQAIAYSVLEALRFAATRVLEMHMEDLQILVMGHIDRDEVNALLWDPMPGGSGLLDQIRNQFTDIVSIAQQVVEDCPAACETSCIDCLQTFRNAYYHKHLDRKRASQILNEWGSHIDCSHTIPPAQPSQEPKEGSYPVNEAEQKLRQLLLNAGFGEGIRGQQIHLDRAIGTTTPDVIYHGDDHQSNEGVCIYLDGLSRHIHGNAETTERDREIRAWLRNNNYEVIEIAVSDLDDKDAMTRHFRRLANYLNLPNLRQAVRDSQAWFSST